MPAAYAHMTLVNVLSRQLEDIVGFPDEVISAVLHYLKFCELGAVSPDYPYLALSGEAKKWSDDMHYSRTMDMVRSGVRYVREMGDEKRRKCLSWLLGYTAHVTMDCTVHPVVELKVGSYAEHKRDHRVCEMNQDVWVFHEKMNLEIATSEYLRAHIGTCCASDESLLDPEIEELWRAMFKDVYPDEYAVNEPNINQWHGRFKFMIDNIVEEGGRLVPFARHVAADMGLVYPLLDEVDNQYLENLAVPWGQRQTYETIFDRAVKNVGDTWLKVVQAVNGDETHLAQTGNWNLDTGQFNDLVFWSIPA